MLDIAKATEILKHHFATVTPEEFAANLEKFCPELFEEEEAQATVNEDRSTLSEDPAQAQNERNLEQLTPAEIYHKPKEDNRLEIATKLLQKGLNAQEVAEILELKVSAIELVPAPLLGKMPTILPTRSSFPPLELEDIAIEPDDEVTIDPAQIQRPVG